MIGTFCFVLLLLYCHLCVLALFCLQNICIRFFLFPCVCVYAWLYPPLRFIVDLYFCVCLLLRTTMQAQPVIVHGTWYKFQWSQCCSNWRPIIIDKINYYIKQVRRKKGGESKRERPNQTIEEMTTTFSTARSTFLIWKSLFYARTTTNRLGRYALIT